VLFLAMVVCCRAVTQPPGQASGFDSSTIEMPGVHVAAPRLVTGADLLNMRDLHGVQISPDGNYVAFVVGQAIVGTNSYRSGLFVVGTGKGAKPVSLGTAGPPHWDSIGEWAVDPPQWSPDSRYIYYRTRRAGSWQVWRWRREGGRAQQVTHAAREVRSFQMSPDGRSLIFTTSEPKEFRQLAERGILYDGQLPSWQGRSVLDLIADARGNNTQLWIHTLRLGAERKASAEESDRYGPWQSDVREKLFEGKTFQGHRMWTAKISPDGRAVAYELMVDSAGDSKKHSYPLFAKPVRGGTPVELTPGAYGFIGEYWWTADSKAIYYTEATGEDGLSKLMMVAAAGGKPKLVLNPSDLLAEFSTDNHGRYVACARENSTTPPQVALADTKTGEVRVLVDLNPEFQNLQLSLAQRLDFYTTSGEHFSGHLVLPPNYQSGKHYPLLITGYSDGAGFLRGGTGDEYPIQVFAANGFAVLNFGVGHNDLTIKPGDFENAILRLQLPTEGMEAAVSKLTDLGLIDPSKVGVTGLSHGAEVLAYAISHSNIFAAAIASGPGSNDPYFFYMGNNLWHEVFAQWGLGGWPESRANHNWHRISPALNADRIRAPLLVNAADTEYLVGLALFTSLKELGKPVEMFVYPLELHIKNQPKHRSEIYQRNLDWFRFWLKGEEDPDSAKADQYARWRELRRAATR
jgi:dipeptidyl aminopeptidase/acylaminoacyl peptidase